MQTATILIDELIRVKTTEQELHRAALQTQFHVVYESLKPLNIIKTTLQQVISSPEIKTTFGDAALGMAAGFAAKKLFVGNSANPLTRVLGALLETAVSRKTEANADTIKSAGSLLLKKLLGYFAAK